MRNHILLTGATGLLGRYLLRDLLSSGRSVVALVRRSRRQTAEQRVEAIVRYWEDQSACELPRPLVLEGDICEPDLGLDSQSLRWISKSCDLVLHNAASLTFHGPDRSGEPWRSNVDGMAHVLEVCRKTGLRDLHHVSTAYVCGLRHGRVLESELNVGQDAGNDYERSKIQAEEMVHAANFLNRPTVYRPAIIVGDSVTGFTTTFHGFYATLRLAHTLIRSIESELNGRIVVQPTRLTLDGSESKNFVPVDWVSAVVTHIVVRPEHHGRTYHLTPAHPVTVRQINEALELASRFCGTVFQGAGTRIENPSEIERLFYEHFQIYNSYWRDDPVFDRSNTLAAAPHLPCPNVDVPMLLRLSQAAIEMDFRWKDELAEHATVRE
jgi:thioester reductase-like protein